MNSLEWYRSEMYAILLESEQMGYAATEIQFSAGDFARVHKITRQRAHQVLRALNEQGHLDSELVEDTRYPRYGLRLYRLHPDAYHLFVQWAYG